MEGYRPETELLLQLMRAALCRPDSALDWLDGCSAPALAEQIEEQSLVTMLYPHHPGAGRRGVGSACRQAQAGL